MQFRVANERQQRLLNDAQGKASRTQAEKAAAKAAETAQRHSKVHGGDVNSQPSREKPESKKVSTPKRAKIKSALDLTRHL